jgi:hypothetical protein
MMSYCRSVCNRKSRVFDVHPEPRVPQDVPVLLGVHLRRLDHLRCQFYDLNHRDLVGGQRAGGDAVGEAQHQAVLRAGMQQRRQVPQQVERTQADQRTEPGEKEQCQQ